MTELGPDRDQLDDTEPSVPATFWIGIGLVALYLGWRLVQGIAWLASRLF